MRAKRFLSSNWMTAIALVAGAVFLAAGIGTLLALLLLVQVPGVVRRVERLPAV